MKEPYLIMNMKEEWVKIIHHSNYSVSNFGQVRNDRTGHILKACFNTDGYLQLNLGKNKAVRVHVIVKESFHGPRPEGYEIHHIDGDRSNPELWNLQFVTRSEHLKISYKEGNKKPVNHKGERNPAAKITRKDAIKIRKKYKSGKYTHKQLAKLYGLSRGHVSGIISGVKWAS